MVFLRVLCMFPYKLGYGHTQNVSPNADTGALAFHVETYATPSMGVPLPSPLLNVWSIRRPYNFCPTTPNSENSRGGKSVVHSAFLLFPLFLIPS